MFFGDLENGDRFVVDGDTFIRVDGATIKDEGRTVTFNAIGMDGTLCTFHEDDQVLPDEPTKPDLHYAQEAEIPLEYFPAFLDALLKSGYQCLCSLDSESNIVIVEYLDPHFCGSHFEEATF